MIGYCALQQKRWIMAKSPRTPKPIAAKTALVKPVAPEAEKAAPEKAVAKSPAPTKATVKETPKQTEVSSVALTAGLKPVPAPAAKPVTAPVVARKRATAVSPAPKPPIASVKAQPPAAVPVASAPAPAPKEQPVKVAAKPAPAAPQPVVMAASVPVAPVEAENNSEISPPPSQPGLGDKAIAATPVPQTLTTPYLEGNAIMNEAIETGKKFAEESKDRVQSVMTEMNDKAKLAMERSSKAMEELGDLTKGNLEAMVETSKIAAKGMEQISQHMAEVGRSSFERTSASLKNFASIKSPTEFFQLNSELMTAAFDTMASETAKASEAMLKLAGEIAQPLSNRASVVSDRIKSIAA